MAAIQGATTIPSLHGGAIDPHPYGAIGMAAAAVSTYRESSASVLMMLVYLGVPCSVALDERENHLRQAWQRRHHQGHQPIDGEPQPP